MIKWHEKLHPISTFDPEEVHDNISLSNNLSPLTNLFLNISINTIGKKNIVIVIPDLMLRPLPLVSYIYSKIKGKSTLVFTQKGKYVDESPIDIHRKNYYLLNWNDYLFYDIPLGIISGNNLESKIFLPRARNQTARRRVIEQQKLNFQDSEKPKILLYSDNKGNKLIKSVNSIILDESTITENIDLDIGTIIFENVDRFIYSDYSANYFLKWLKEFINKDISLIFHFSNPQSKFINQIKEKTNSFVIPGTLGFFRGNNYIKNEYMNYLNSDKVKQHINFLNKYNLDLEHFYTDSGKVSILKPLLESGNIDKQYKSAFYLSNKVNQKTLINQSQYGSLLNLLYDLPNLVVNPSKYKKIYDSKGKTRFYEILNIINDFAFNLRKETLENKFTLESFLSEIYGIYKELSRCDRYFQKGVFSRIAKDYQLLELAEKMKFSSEKIVFATYSPYEKTLLEEDFKKLNIDSIEVETIDWLNHRYFDRSSFKIVFPGPLKNKNLSELFMPYKEIIFLSYDGINFNHINRQLKYITEYSIEEERVSLAFFNEVFNFFKISTDNELFNDFVQRKQQIENNKLINLKFADDHSMNPFERIKNKILNSSPVDKDLVAINQAEKRIKEFLQDFSDPNIVTECIECHLKNIGDEQIIYKELPLDKTYFYLKTIGGKIFEGTAKNLKENYFVVILDNNEKKSLLELIIDIFDLEKGVNQTIIEYWKKSLMTYIKNNKLTYKALYDTYLSKGGNRNYQTIRNWAKGSVIGPEDPLDLLRIGESIGDNLIIENYNVMMNEIEKVRSIHVSTGKRLKMIIKKVILEGEFIDLSELTYEEYLFYEKVKNGIYEIVKLI